MSIYHRVSLTCAASIIALTLGCSSQTTQTESSHPSTSPHAAAESTATATQTEAMTDVDYVINLGLMKGHLMVAKELLDQGNLEQAEPHIGHPVEEIYEGMKPALQQRNVQEFKTILTQLHDQVKTGTNTPQINTSWNQAMEAINAAMATVPANQFQDPQFILQVINGLLETAQAEYEAAIIDGKVVEVVEYQDSRGFTLYADQLYQTISATLKTQHPDIDQQMQANLTQLKQAWPSVIPPDKIVMSPTQVSELAEEIYEGGEKLTVKP